MGWKQDISPNVNDQSLVVFFGRIGQGNPLGDWYGDCAAVVRNAFGIVEPQGSTAWQIYSEFNQINHEDRNWPIGVYFPIWFSGYGGAGHVAIAYWNGTSMQIWTSPYTHKPYFDHYTDVDRLASGYGVTYAGWSEDFAGVRLIDFVAATPPHPFTIENMAAKQMVSDGGATLWNLDDTDWAQFNTNPVSRLAPGEVVTVTAIAHHNLGGSYYMTDPNSPVGYNTVDLHDAPAPAPEPDPTTTTSTTEASQPDPTTTTTTTEAQPTSTTTTTTEIPTVTTTTTVKPVDKPWYATLVEILRGLWDAFTSFSKKEK